MVNCFLGWKLQCIICPKTAQNCPKPNFHCFLSEVMCHCILFKCQIISERKIRFQTCVHPLCTLMFQSFVRYLETKNSRACKGSSWCLLFACSDRFPHSSVGRALDSELLGLWFESDPNQTFYSLRSSLKFSKSRNERSKCPESQFPQNSIEFKLYFIKQN